MKFCEFQIHNTMLSHRLISIHWTNDALFGKNNHSEKDRRELAVMRPAFETTRHPGGRRLIDPLRGIGSASRQIAIALTHRNFRLLWMGALTSSIGTWMQKVAQAWLIIAMTGSRSAFFLGLDSFLGELPLVLFTMIGGVF